MQLNFSKCSGCKACENICPVNCINVKMKNNHCFELDIDKNKCIKCKKCLKVCPMKQKTLKDPIESYVGWSEKRIILKNSSSGGVASTLYHYAINNNIHCVGVDFDNNYNLKYRFILSREDIKKSAGSKYVFSDMNNIYSEIEKKLRDNEKVLFIGLPCHVSGLKNYCMEKRTPMNNLYTTDIVCHGVIMPTIFKDYLKKKLRTNKLKNGMDIFFRRKDNPFGLTIIQNGKEIYKKSRFKDEYMISFHYGYYINSCYNCPYATKKRSGDITVKDSSALKTIVLKKRKEFNASEILVNSEKGQELVEMLRRENMFLQSIDVDNVLNADIMFQHPTRRPENYKLFYKSVDDYNYITAVRIMLGFKTFIRYVKNIRFNL